MSWLYLGICSGSLTPVLFLLWQSQMSAEPFPIEIFTKHFLLVLLEILIKMVTSQNIYTIGVVTGCAAVTVTLPVSLTAVCLGFTFHTLSKLLIHSAVLLHMLTYNIRKYESGKRNIFINLGQPMLYTFKTIHYILFPRSWSRQGRSYPQGDIQKKDLI